MTEETNRPARVTVTDVDIPFGSMVWLMVKWTLAAIPALLILAAIGGAVVALFATLGMVGQGLSSLSRSEPSTLTARTPPAITSARLARAIADERMSCTQITEATQPFPVSGSEYIAVRCASGESYAVRLAEGLLSSPIPCEGFTAATGHGCFAR